MAKIGLVSFEDDVGEDEQQVVNNKKRWSLFKDIRDYATNNKITHIFFSGSTLCDKRQREKNSVLSDVRHIGRIFKKFNVIFEVNKKGLLENKFPPYGLYAYRKGVKVFGPVCQLLWSSKAETELYIQLWNDVENGGRSISLGSKKVLILICGELNILHNQQSNKNKVDGLRKPLFGKEIRDFDYDILFNPTHTPLKGHYGKYKRRLEYISKGKQNRFAMLNFNVPDNQNRRTAAFIAYRNGREIKRKINEKENWSNGWAMRIIEF